MLHVGGLLSVHLREGAHGSSDIDEPEAIDAYIGPPDELGETGEELWRASISSGEADPDDPGRGSSQRLHEPGEPLLRDGTALIDKQGHEKGGGLSLDKLTQVHATQCATARGITPPTPDPFRRRAQEVAQGISELVDASGSDWAAREVHHGVLRAKETESPLGASDPFDTSAVGVGRGGWAHRAHGERPCLREQRSGTLQSRGLEGELLLEGLCVQGAPGAAREVGARRGHSWENARGAGEAVPTAEGERW